MTQAAPIPYVEKSVLSLKQTDLEVMQRAIKLLFHLAHQAVFIDQVPLEESAQLNPGNFGALMGYDFHITSDGTKLIEINTNAGGALLCGYHAAKVLPGRCQAALSKAELEQIIVDMFVREYALVKSGPLRTIAIADDKPEAQGLYAEFGLFVDVFKHAGITAFSCDTSELVYAGTALTVKDQAIDLVYLRDTDFLLQSPRTAQLRKAYLAKQVVVTATPREYQLLAHKQRLCLFSSVEKLRELLPDADAQFLSSVIPETRLLSELGPDQAWKLRNTLVFKPSAMFGSRAVYRGDKVSRKKFDEFATSQDYLVQKYIPPGTLSVETSEGVKDMKYDVRAYVYQDQILLLGARVYQGQVTNMHTKGGGFAAVCVG